MRKLTVKQLRGLIAETLDVTSARQRWPWIQHFDSVNDEGMPHPGMWVSPTQDDFETALQRMPESEIGQLVDAGINGMGLELDPDVADEMRDGWRNDPELWQHVFHAWAGREFRDHRDAENRYFAASRKRDAEASRRAMQDPETRRMAGLVHSRDRAEALGKPWFPDDDK